MEGTVNVSPPVAFSELGRIDTPFGRSRFASGGVSTATAASAYPGTLVTQGPAFISSQFLGMITGPMCSAGFPCEALPKQPSYPLVAEAQYPSNPDASSDVEGQTVAAGPMSYKVGEVRAHAGTDSASSVATMSGYTIMAPGATSLDPSLALFYVGSMEAVTHQGFNDDGALVVEATARLSGISMYGGAVRIDSLEAISIAKSDGKGHMDTESRVTVGGATANGQPAEVTEQGLVVAGNSTEGPMGALRGAVAQMFQATGQSVRLVEATHETRDGTASSDATGMIMTWKLDASQVPAGTSLVGNFVMGLTSATAYASQETPSSPTITEDLGAKATSSGLTTTTSPGAPAAFPAFTQPGGSATTESTLTAGTVRISKLLRLDLVPLLVAGAVAIFALALLSLADRHWLRPKLR
jgi:hypothetical protein